MKIGLCSIPVSDQEHALTFYTEKMGFVKKVDFAVGDARWLTVVSPDDPGGTELVLEPNAEYPAMKALKEALVSDGIPYTAFEVENVDAEYERLGKLGVRFTAEPADAGDVKYTVLDDTCGNLIQIYQVMN